MSLQVNRDDLVALREQRKNRPEHLARPKPTVQEDQRAPCPVRFVVELDAVDLGVLADALRVGRPMGLYCCAPSVLDGNCGAEHTDSVGGSNSSVPLFQPTKQESDGRIRTGDPLFTNQAAIEIQVAILAFHATQPAVSDSQPP